MIRQAWFDLITNAGFTVPISWPGTDFDPPDGYTGEWLEVRLFENEPVDMALSNTGTVTARGILQINACTRSGVGTIKVDTLARLVQQTFPKGTPILGRVRVTRAPWRLSDVVGEDRVKIPVSFSYSS